MRKTRFTLNVLSGAVVSAALMLAGSASQAATLGTITHNYGNGVGQVDPGGNDALSDGYVTVSDQSSSRFNDSFDLSAFANDTITAFDLVLTFSRSGPSLIPLESWLIRVQGSNAASSLDDFFRPLVDILSPQDFHLDASTLLAGDAFAASVASGSYGLWFSEITPGADSFRLASAALTVSGTPAAVPVPAAGLMLLAGLGGLGALKRKRKAA